MGRRRKSRRKRVEKDREPTDGIKGTRNQASAGSTELACWSSRKQQQVKDGVAIIPVRGTETVSWRIMDDRDLFNIGNIDQT